MVWYALVGVGVAVKKTEIAIEHGMVCHCGSGETLGSLPPVIVAMQCVCSEVVAAERPCDALTSWNGRRWTGTLLKSH